MKRAEIYKDNELIGAIWCDEIETYVSCDTKDSQTRFIHNGELIACIWSSAASWVDVILIM